MSDSDKQHDRTGALDWYASGSSDAKHKDQEVDFGELGSPGGAVWGSVVEDEDGWAWGVFDRWLTEEATLLDGGEVATEIEAKEAVEQWIAAQKATE